MTENSLSFIALLSPLVFVATAVASWFQGGSKPRQILVLSKTASTISLLIVVLCCIFIIRHGSVSFSFWEMYGIGFGIRLDAISLAMSAMISLLGFVIIRFSTNYLDGDPKQGAFIGKLAATLASVQLLVLSGNLGLLFLSWVLTSISLHRLLVFYPERPGAQIAAKKKFILARFGDAALLLAIVLLYQLFGTGDLKVIFSSLNSGAALPGAAWKLEISALLLALAAVLKSAQFPTHGWLIEVMETPTPVSALLHAGLLNAGPFLIIRMAYVMEAGEIAPLFLLLVGGITALFASVAYLTQTAIKTALGYSSVGHMGFSLMVCGLGVYPAAMLHLVAHSFYKAHAFLSSGSIIDLVRASKVKDETRDLAPSKVILGILMSVALYAGFVWLWGIDPQDELALMFVGAVIVMGLSKLFTTAFTRKVHASILGRAILLSLLVTTAFFSLESATGYLLGAQVPDMPVPDLAKTIVAGVMLLGFAIVVLIQILAPRIANKPQYQALAIHVRNGFYVNAWFDKKIGAYQIPSAKNSASLTANASANIFPERN
ncbi:NAD(P)H-quinone oxidoreductase subunit 5 [Cyclobacterium lianum]|uniref:Probable inorganic carbon transporter subunit DabB n=1 Tax=Cyclobacterium lianum TaxID=388280 RepID=A0A1M7KFH8_9BACT|nr:proton-conducting transporter membrane subunit [Cyclobacterium lianum]SHM64021.1 NAD(P)H-quinone oxidoreductase subunit 5 [Cyclobacterium lianum]